MTTAAAALDRLKRERPEWGPWLAVVEQIVHEIAARRWDDVVPPTIRPDRPAVPLLAGATLAVREKAVRRLFITVIRLASAAGTPKTATLGAAIHQDLNVLALFTAALCQDSVRLDGMAAACGADTEAFQAVAALLPLPFLHACHRRFASSIPENWTDGYCPLCAAWPAFVEVRGIERRRHFRCGRCGAGWHARALCCPFCSMDDHTQLVTLVPESGDSRAVIDACRRCLGYVKAFSRLQGCPPAEVMIDDLGSVALDVAALEQGYRRPPGGGYPLGVTIPGEGAARRFFAWTP
jgi:FdhE protein